MSVKLYNERIWEEIKMILMGLKAFGAIYKDKIEQSSQDKKSILCFLFERMLVCGTNYSLWDKDSYKTLLKLIKNKLFQFD